MNALANKTAIVTGASSGIGYATAKLFAREGAKVVVAARRQAQLDALVADIATFGGEAVAVAGDVRQEAFANALVETAVQRFGGLDIAFNNAAITGEIGAATDTSLADWREVIETNLTSAFLGAKYQIPAMLERGGGSLIFTSSVAGHTIGLAGAAAYAASKAALIGLTKVLAAEFGPRGVRANAILPGAVDTPMHRAMHATEEANSLIAGLHALKRLAQPEELARSVLYLASDASTFTTGSALLVDGGVSINRG